MNCMDSFSLFKVIYEPQLEPEKKKNYQTKGN